MLLVMEATRPSEATTTEMSLPLRPKSVSYESECGVSSCAHWSKKATLGRTAYWDSDRYPSTAVRRTPL
jgi:hypothetical protein